MAPVAGPRSPSEYLERRSTLDTAARLMASSSGRAFLPPPTHPHLRGAHPSAPVRSSGTRHAVPPPLTPPRPPLKDESLSANEVQDDSILTTTPTPGAFEPLVLPEVEEDLSEVQLRELYDDEEIDRFLHLFSAVSGKRMDTLDMK